MGAGNGELLVGQPFVAWHRRAHCFDRHKDCVIC